MPDRGFSVARWTLGELSDETPRRTLLLASVAAGVTVAEPLISDGAAPGHESGFEAMIRHNVRVITTALGTK